MREAVPLPRRCQEKLARASSTSAKISKTRCSLVNSNITSIKIASGQVVKSLNGLTDAVILTAGTNVNLATDGNGLRISATPGTVVTNAGWSVSGNAGTDVLATLFTNDALYEGGEQTALQLPTFISNHDMGRFAWFVRTDRPQASDDEVLKRVRLA